MSESFYPRHASGHVPVVTPDWDAVEELFLATAAQTCRNHSCAGVPCGGCQAGGVCDAMCWCGAARGFDDEEDL